MTYIKRTRGEVRPPIHDGPIVEVMPPQCEWCPVEPKPVQMERGIYQRWLAGGSLAELLPDFTPQERERLNTGVHSKCAERKAQLFEPEPAPPQAVVRRDEWGSIGWGLRSE